ncbi:unnamed protein product [Penicillium nalgiovense]|nr:unnamed protein product [Penicillium nalgiovense]
MVEVKSAFGFSSTRTSTLTSTLTLSPALSPTFLLKRRWLSAYWLPSPRGSGDSIGDFSYPSGPIGDMAP